jgi:hypothetical protein
MEIETETENLTSVKDEIENDSPYESPTYSVGNNSANKFKNNNSNNK